MLLTPFTIDAHSLDLKAFHTLYSVLIGVAKISPLLDLVS